MATYVPYTMERQLFDVLLWAVTNLGTLPSSLLSIKENLARTNKVHKVELYKENFTLNQSCHYLLRPVFFILCH